MYVPFSWRFGRLNLPSSRVKSSKPARSPLHTSSSSPSISSADRGFADSPRPRASSPSRFHPPAAPSAQVLTRHHGSPSPRQQRRQLALHSTRGSSYRPRAWSPCRESHMSASSLRADDRLLPRSELPSESLPSFSRSASWELTFVRPSELPKTQDEVLEDLPCESRRPAGLRRKNIS